MRTGFTVRGIVRDATFHVIPRLKGRRTGLDRGNAAADLCLPRFLGIGIGRAVQARQQLSRQFGPGGFTEAQSVGQQGRDGVRHVRIYALAPRLTSGCTRPAAGRDVVVA